MKKNCEFSKTEFVLSERDLAFYERLNVPVPRLCPDERLRRRLAFRNERILYKRKCDSCSKSIISIYSDDKPYPVCCGDCWWGDKWDGKNFGVEIDFSRPFFEQYAELQRVTPRLYMFETNNQNSEYTNGAAYNRDCYMTFVSDHNEDTHYCYGVYECRTCLDLMNAKNCELCYDCIGCVDCYELSFSINCSNCKSSYFLHNCRSCTDCMFCTNLRHKKYCFNNEQLSKEDYQKKHGQMAFQTCSGVKHRRELFAKLLDRAIEPNYVGEHNEDVSGDYVFHSTRSNDCYDSHELEDCSFVIHGNGAKDCYDCYVLVDGAELCVDSLSIVSVNRGGYNCAVWHGNDIWYSDLCTNSDNLFGCVGLKRSSYCILNKQYSESEYRELSSRLVEHMKETGEYGEYFPIALSPFGYNETVAQEYFPLTPDKAAANGWKWHSESEVSIQGKIGSLPDSIKDVADDIISQTLLCDATGGPYRISSVELKFYRKNHIAPPQECFDARHLRRLALRNPRRVRSSECNSCHSAISTSINPDWDREILCKDCYASMVS